LAAEVLLVTGGNGLLGTKLIEQALANRSGEVVSVSRQPCSNGYLGAFPFYQVDLAEPGAFRQVADQVRPDLVIHTAAMTDVDGCERRPAEAWRDNVAASQQVAEACRAVGAHLVHLSTEYVFDGRAGPYRETDPTNPISVYGRTKLESEQVVQAINPGFAIARTTVLYGQAPNIRPNFVTWLIGALESGQAVRVVDDQVGSPTLADNLAEICLALASGRASGVYHTVGAEVIDRFRFAQLICQVFELDAGLLSAVSTASLAQAAPRPLRGGLLIEQLRAAFPGLELLDAQQGLRRLRAQQLAAATGR
jgi:dTDP-4-dehydrorhamnose reductase